MQRRKTGKISIFSSLDVIFDFLMSWIKNSNQVSIWNQYQIESECWNRVFELNQKIDIKYLSQVRRLISKLSLMISLLATYFLSLRKLFDFTLLFLHDESTSFAIVSESALLSLMQFIVVYSSSRFILLWLYCFFQKFALHALWLFSLFKDIIWLVTVKTIFNL